MRKFTKEIAALIASAAVSAAIGTSSAYSEEIVQTAGVVSAPEKVISSPLDEDALVDGLMMPDPIETTMPPLAGEPLPPDEYIETTTTTTTIPPLAGVTVPAVTTITELTSTIPPLAGVPLPPDETVEPTTEEIPPLAGDIALADGDVNGDGVLNVADVVKLQQFLSRKVTINERQMMYADINGDGNVNVFDLIAMKRKVTEKININNQQNDDEPISLGLWDYDSYTEYITENGITDQIVTYDEIKDIGEFINCIILSNSHWGDYSKLMYSLNDGSGHAVHIITTLLDKVKDTGLADIPESEIRYPDMRTTISDGITGKYLYDGKTYYYSDGKLLAVSWNDDKYEYRLTGSSMLYDYPDNADTFTSKLLFPCEAETISNSYDAESVIFIGVSSLPESAAYIREYSSPEKINKIVSYLNDLHLRKDFSENPEKYDGMTWVVRLGFENGDKKTIYLSGNMFYLEEGSDWLKMYYDEAAAFDSIIYDNLSD